MILILPAAFAAICAYIKLHTKKGTETAVSAILLFDVLLLIITNGFSFFHALNRYTVFFSWLFVFFVFALLCVKQYRKTQHFKLPWRRCLMEAADGASSKDGIDAANAMHRTDGAGSMDGSRWIRLLMWGVLAILSLILLIGAIFTVPYNYDSMTYHLARVGYWIDHQSVAHYVTNVDRQIYSPVLAEYHLLHIMLLCGNDSLVNFLQYGSMFAAAYFIYHSARRLGTNHTFSLFGVFVFMMMPLTISQSITTQNDLFAAMLFAIFVYQLIGVVSWEHIVLDRRQVMGIVQLGLTVALAYLAKTSVCASMLFFMPWLLIVRLRKKDRFGKLIKSAAVAAISILLPVLETWIRTYRSSGSIMTSTASGDIMVATKNVSYILVNILKNFSLLITQHLYRPLNGFVYRIAIHTGQLLGVEVNNEAIAFHGFDFLNHMNMGDDMYSHDKTPSAFAAYLAVAAGILLLILLLRLMIKGKKKPEAVRGQWRLSLGCAVSAWLSLGFIMALLRWQPWGTRLMYPALAVTVIMSANLLWLFAGKLKKPVQNGLLLVLIALCTLLAVPSVIYNMEPAADYLEAGCQDRMAYYFTYNQRRAAYEELLKKAKEEGVTDIGLLISSDGYDYPLWLMFHEEYPQAKLRHILAGDGGDGLTDDTDAPEAILMVEREELSVGDQYEYGGVTYICTYVHEGNHDAYLSRVTD